MRIRSWVLGLVVLIVIFGGIGLTMTFNLWHTKTTKAPAKFNEGVFAGEYNPADIRGSYSFGDISDLFKIPLSDLVTAFGLKTVDNPEDFKNKDLETLYANLDGGEIGTDSVRVFVALYTGLPYTISENTYLLQPAVDILKIKVTGLTESQTAFLESHSVTIGDSETISPPKETEQIDSEEHEASTEGIIKGKTTFGELLEWGLSEGEIEAVIGEELPAGGIAVRDFVTDKGLEFAPIKEALQVKLDALH
ncbi:hypothetical protein ACFLVB_00365 [Chloroflexota bacterium]